MVVKVKENIESLGILKIRVKVKNTFYEDKEMQNIMIDYYLRKENLIILLESIP